MSASTNPLIRPRTPFDRRMVAQMEMGKPIGGLRTFHKLFPGGTSITTPRAVSKIAPAITPFTITAKGKVYPGLVGLKMPTLSGGALDTTSNVIDLTDHGGNFKVWFTLNFSVTYLSTFLSSYTLNSVTVDTGTSIPADDDHTKHLQFNTITAKKPTTSFFRASIPIALYDNGANATLLHYG
ncbi:hypothetical protein [Prosthecobacter sp.]|uniref:hypothetical protein n=1 Tax=Prosthecobacter sp. TaxID=1965333 RepID=UPI0037840347